MSEKSVTLGNQIYVSRPNAIGIDGYNYINNLVLAKRFQKSSQVWIFFQSFCEQRGVKPDEIPIKVDLPPQDEDDMHSLLTASIIMVLESFGYNLADAAGLTLVSPKGLIVTTLGNGKQTMLIEHYDAELDRISVANRSLYDSEIREQLERRYNIPPDVSDDYLMVYLTAHSAVHRIQKMENRLGKNPEGERYGPSRDMKDSLELSTEKEAHNIGIKITDKIWQRIMGLTL